MAFINNFTIQINVPKNTITNVSESPEIFTEMLLSAECDFGLPARRRSDLRRLGIFGFYAAYNGSFLPAVWDS
jgi:hypothetical protein